MKFNTPNKEVKNGSAFNSSKSYLKQKATGISTFKPSEVVCYFRNENIDDVEKGKIPVNKVFFSDIKQKTYSFLNYPVNNIEFELTRKPMVYSAIYENSIPAGGNLPLGRMPFYGIKVRKERDPVSGPLFDREHKYVEMPEDVVGDIETNLNGYLLDFPKFIHIDLKKALDSIYDTPPNILVNFGQTGRESQGDSSKEEGRSKLIFYPARMVFSMDDEGLKSAKKIISYYVNNVLQPYLVNFGNTLRICIKQNEIIESFRGKVPQKDKEELDSSLKKLLLDKREIIKEIVKISGIEVIKDKHGRFIINDSADLDLLQEIIRVSFDGIMNAIANKQYIGFPPYDENCPIHKLLFSKLQRLQRDDITDFSKTNQINTNFINQGNFAKTGTCVKDFLMRLLTSYDSLILKENTQSDLVADFKSLCDEMKKIVH